MRSNSSASSWIGDTGPNPTHISNPKIHGLIFLFAYLTKIVVTCHPELRGVLKGAGLHKKKIVFSNKNGSFE